MVSNMAVWIILLFISLATPHSNVQRNVITDIIAQTVNNYVKDLSPGSVREKVVFHYKLLGLMDSQERWVDQRLNELNSNLLPRYQCPSS